MNEKDVPYAQQGVDTLAWATKDRVAALECGDISAASTLPTMNEFLEKIAPRKVKVTSRPEAE